MPYGLRIGPGIAAGLGVLVLLVAGDLRAPDVLEALDVLWRPLVALASIMVMTGVAARVGLLHQLATMVVRRAGRRASHLFALVFALSFVTAAIFNNDAAILVLTPVVVALVRQRYPDRPSLLVPFAFAVFMAAGVAPFLTSNPMNTVMAGAAGIDFNAYALRMVPVALVAAMVTFGVLRWLFATELAAAELAAAQPAAPGPASPTSDPASPGGTADPAAGVDPAAGAAGPSAGGRWTAAQRRSLLLMVLVLLAYPAFALAGLHVFVVAAAGAVLALALAWRHRAGRPPQVLKEAVAWEILFFLLGMFLLAKGLQNIGVVDRLRELYEGLGTGGVAVISAVGSALINNHSMALTNLLAIGDLPGAAPDTYFAAMVGGDLGPRLLPIGSLAGLMWLALLGRLEVTVPLRRFVGIGLVVTIPTLAASLLLLALI
jgi:arsenical pump membrane protein